MCNASPEPSPAPLRAFHDLVASGPPGPEAIGPALAALEEASLLEHALSLLRQVGTAPAWEPFRARLKAAVAASRERRMNLWQVDPHRKTMRLQFSVTGPACRLHPPALAAQLARALLDAGLPLAMGLEKTPRPALHLGPPLPLEVPGRGEWADAVLTRGPGLPMAELPGRINACAPEGLTVLQCLLVPNHASPAADLCRSALWRWPCPEASLPLARASVEAFLAAETFGLDKPGKSGGQKAVKRVEIRPLVAAMDWQGPVLEFRTALPPGQALNPRKLLGAILGVEPASVLDLERLSLELADDPRLLQADRYEPKLHNMFEDAVLLEAGSHIRIVEGDDDEPIILGG